MESIDFYEEHFEEMKRHIRHETDRKIFQHVFDAKTFSAIQTLANKGSFDVLEHIISTGKEAHVFAASDGAGNQRAVKIFKKETTDFKKMIDYIKGDPRFRDLRKDRNSVVLAWAKKEFKNLRMADEAGASVPLPIAMKENVIVMEFIGENGKASLPLKEARPSAAELADYREQAIEFLARLYLAGLVHADLSEYNTLLRGKKLVVIDFAQALLLSHPKAKEFFERDVRNMANYFSKNGLETTFEGLYALVKERKEKLEKAK